MKAAVHQGERPPFAQRLRCAESPCGTPEDPLSHVVLPMVSGVANGDWTGHISPTRCARRALESAGVQS